MRDVQLSHISRVASSLLSMNSLRTPTLSRTTPPMLSAHFRILSQLEPSWGIWRKRSFLRKRRKSCTVPLPSKATLTERPKRGRAVIFKSDHSRIVLSLGTVRLSNASSRGDIGPSSATATSGPFELLLGTEAKSSEIGAMLDCFPVREEGER